jgi:hypothetical protein
MSARKKTYSSIRSNEVRELRGQGHRDSHNCSACRLRCGSSFVEGGLPRRTPVVVSTKMLNIDGRYDGRMVEEAGLTLKADSEPNVVSSLAIRLQPRTIVKNSASPSWR